MNQWRKWRNSAKQRVNHLSQHRSPTFYPPNWNTTSNQRWRNWSKSVFPSFETIESSLFVFRSRSRSSLIRRVTIRFRRRSNVSTSRAYAENFLSKSNSPIESRLFSVEFVSFSLAKKLHRHTNANRQLVFDIFSARTGLSTSFLITRTRLLMLNDYEPNTKPSALNDLREKLKVEIHRSLELQVQSHNQAVK